MLYCFCKFHLLVLFDNVYHDLDWNGLCALLRAVARGFALLRAFTVGSDFCDFVDLLEFRGITFDGIPAYEISVAGRTLYANAFYMAVFAETLY